MTTLLPIKRKSNSNAFLFILMLSSSLHGLADIPCLRFYKHWWTAVVVDGFVPSCCCFLFVNFNFNFSIAISFEV